MLMAARILLATTMNFDGRLSLWLRNVTTYVLATAGAKIAKKRGESKGGFPCTPLNARDNSLTHQQGFFMLEIPALAACGWLLMHNLTENLPKEVFL